MARRVIDREDGSIDQSFEKRWVEEDSTMEMGGKPVDERDGSHAFKESLAHFACMLSLKAGEKTNRQRSVEGRNS